MIDIWLLFGLVLPFFAFTLSIFEELVVQSEEEKLSKVGDEQRQQSSYQQKHHKHHHHHHHHHDVHQEHHNRHDDHQKHHHHHHDDQQDHDHNAHSSFNHEQVGSDRRISKVAPATPLPRVLGKRSPRSRQAVIHMLGRRMLPIVTAAFCFLYCIVATFLYFFPSLQYGL